MRSNLCNLLSRASSLRSLGPKTKQVDHSDELSLPSVNKCHEDADHTDTTTSPEDSWRSFSQLSYRDLNHNNNEDVVVCRLSPVNSNEEFSVSSQDSSDSIASIREEESDESTLEHETADEDTFIFYDENEVDDDEDDEDSSHHSGFLHDSIPREIHTTSLEPISVATQVYTAPQDDDSVIIRTVPPSQELQEEEPTFRPLHRLSVSKRIMASSELCTLRRAMERASSGDDSSYRFGSEASGRSRRLSANEPRPLLRRRESIVRASTGSLRAFQEAVKGNSTEKNTVQRFHEHRCSMGRLESKRSLFCDQQSLSAHSLLSCGLEH